MDLDRLTVAFLFDVLGFRVDDLDEAIRWALIELLLRRASADT